MYLTNQVVDDIFDWLDQEPGFDLVEEYARRIPQERAGDIQDVVLDYIAALAEEKLTSLGDAMPGFGEAMDEKSQLDWIRNFATYDADSVITQLAARFSQVKVEVENHGKLTLWSKHYIGRWTSACLLASVFSHLRRSVYVGSLFNVRPTDEQAKTLYAHIREVYLEDGRLFDFGGQLSGDAERKIRDVLSELKLFPSEYIEKLLLPESDFERASVLGDLLYVFRLLTVMGGETFYANQETIQLLSWKNAREDVEARALGVMEGQRQARLGVGDDMGAFFVWLADVWNIDMLESGQLPQQLIDFIANLKREDAAHFRDLFMAFLKDGYLLEILVDPYDPGNVLTHLSLANTPAEFNGMLDDLCGPVGEQGSRPMLRNFLTLARQVLGRISKIENSLPASIAPTPAMPAQYSQPPS